MEKHKRNRTLPGSNYEKQVYIARELFLNYDQEKIIQKFHLRQDESHLFIQMLDQEYRISRTTGEIEVKKNDGYESCINYEVVMTIYDVLCCSKDHLQLSGQWCPLGSLQVTRSPGTDMMTRSCALTYLGHAEELNAACLKLGGTHLAVPASADACYQFDLFSFFPVIVQFWDGDDEFEPKIMVLWDRHALDYMHFETLYYAMGHLLGRLEELREGRSETTY